MKTTLISKCYKTISFIYLHYNIDNLSNLTSIKNWSHEDLFDQIVTIIPRNLIFTILYLLLILSFTYVVNIDTCMKPIECTYVIVRFLRSDDRKVRRHIRSGSNKSSFTFFLVLPSFFYFDLTRPEGEVDHRFLFYHLVVTLQLRLGGGKPQIFWLT